MLPILMDRLDHVSSQYYYFMGTGMVLGVSVLFYNGILLDKFQDAKEDQKPQPGQSELGQFFRAFGGPICLLILATGVGIGVFWLVDISDARVLTCVAYTVVFVAYVLVFLGGSLTQSRLLGFLLAYPPTRAQGLTLFKFVTSALVGLLLGTPISLFVFFRSRAVAHQEKDVIALQDQESAAILLCIGSGLLALLMVYYLLVDPRVGQSSVVRKLGQYLLTHRS